MKPWKKRCFSPFGPAGKPNFGPPVALVHRLGPGDQLVIGQRVQIGAFGQELQRLLVGHHQEGRLHPGGILLFRRAQLAEFQHGWR